MRLAASSGQRVPASEESAVSWGRRGSDEEKSVVTWGGKGGGAKRRALGSGPRLLLSRVSDAARPERPQIPIC